MTASILTLACAPASPPAAASVSASASPPAALPPALAALQTSLAQLQLSSERAVIAETVRGPSEGRGRLRGPLGPFRTSALARTGATESVALVKLAIEVSYAEQKASFEGSVLGLPISGRIIGTTSYVKQPFIAIFDGGRPWLQSTSKGVFAEELAGTGSASPPAGATTAQRAFGGVFETFAHARSVTALGTQTVDEQPTAGFLATVATKARNGVSPLEGNKIDKLLQPLARFEAFFAADGVPLVVRFVESFHSKKLAHVELVAQSDVATLNQPIAPVLPPPASETITQAELEHTEAHPGHIPKSK